VTYTDGVITITRRPITVQAANQSRVYGDANPNSGAVTLTSGTLVNSDALGTASVNSSATNTTVAGQTAALTPRSQAFTTGQSSNYTVTYADGVLSITQRPITVQAANQSRLSGDANPSTGEVTLTSGTLANTDALGTASVSSTATSTTAAGLTAALTPSAQAFNTGQASNYMVTYADGVLRIEPRPIQNTAVVQLAPVVTPTVTAVVKPPAETAAIAKPAAAAPAEAAAPAAAPAVSAAAAESAPAASPATASAAAPASEGGGAAASTASGAVSTTGAAASDGAPATTAASSSTTTTTASSTSTGGTTTAAPSGGAAGGAAATAPAGSAAGSSTSSAAAPATAAAKPGAAAPAAAASPKAAPAAAAKAAATPSAAKTAVGKAATATTKTADAKGANAKAGGTSAASKAAAPKTATANAAAAAARSQAAVAAANAARTAAMVSAGLNRPGMGSPGMGGAVMVTPPRPLAVIRPPATDRENADLLARLRKEAMEKPFDPSTVRVTKHDAKPMPVVDKVLEKEMLAPYDPVNAVLVTAMTPQEELKESFESTPSPRRPVQLDPRRSKASTNYYESMESVNLMSMLTLFFMP
jgi:hypothetical protein